MKKKRIVSLKLLNWIIEKLAVLSPIVLYGRKKHSFLIFTILIENNQKAFQPITLMCDHYQYTRKVKKPGERQVHSERIKNFK